LKEKILEKKVELDSNSDVDEPIGSSTDDSDFIEVDEIQEEISTNEELISEEDVNDKPVESTD